MNSMLDAEIAHRVLEANVNVPCLAASHLDTLAIDHELDVGIGLHRHMQPHDTVVDRVQRVGMIENLPAGAQLEEAHAALTAGYTVDDLADVGATPQRFSRRKRPALARLVGPVAAGRP